ncbi:MAG: OmpA family protein [Crocinitomicaceae bacterium]|nr:OmpA family protein [Crocinitomicaceae bacterium]
MILFISPNIHASELALEDTTKQRPYEHDIKFEGANIHIDGNYQYLLETIVDYLLKNPEIYVHIRGHVCCRPGKRISRRRARNVYRFLKRQGISKQRMSHAGYSNTIPLAFPEKTDEDERQNRRVDFVLSKERIEKK